MDVVSAFMQDLAAGPAWVYAWVMFMGIAFMPAIPFSFSRVEARWALLAMMLAFPSMMALHAAVGMARLLGIVHIVFWTPLAVYLWRRRASWRVKDTLAGKWLVVLFATVLVSLVFDYTDVVRYLLGDRS